MQRRRKQIRLAQRAHRQREKAALSRHEARIAQLETAIQKMHIAFSSFGEHLTNSGALVPHTALQAHLHDTFTTHKSLAEEAGVDPSPQSLQAESGMRTEPCLLSQLDGLSPPRLVDPAINSTSMPAVDMSVFIRHLRLASARYAVFLLRDSSVSLEGLRRKFRFLLSIISREDLISYFEAALVATIHPERMVEWEELPFFRVGGAGTHFVHSRSWRYESHHPVWEDPLSKFPPDVQGEMDGRWYDIRDLQGFLQERAVHLCASPPASSNMTAVNVSALIKGKMLPFEQ